MAQLILVTGGARSGKSSFAQRLAGNGDVLFIATGAPIDDEMAARIQKHRADRPALWRTVESQLDIVSPMEFFSGTVLMDCLGSWVCNCMLEMCKDYESATEEQLSLYQQTLLSLFEEWINAVDQRTSTVIAVSNEAGAGLVPASRMSRFYRDVLGSVNMLCAQHAQCVYMMHCGIAQCIKGME